jgi:hypothetical protein
MHRYQPVKNIIRAGLLVCLCLPFTVYGASLRCGSRIIKIGMTSADVLGYCGEPDEREVEEHDIRSGNRVTGTTQLNIWTYTQAGNRKVLEFDQDRLINIR